MYSIYIVGAGPGDPELLTLKGRRLLEEADLVMYAGSLVNPELLKYCTENCELIDSAPLSLEEQVAAMVVALREGKRVVRLHTGDPSLYGAIGEQIAMLADEGIDAEIVPGVSSLQGAAARLGIEYTVPGVTQTLICTRAAGRTPVPDAESIERLASHGATMVVFLSAGCARDVADACMKGGVSADTPAAWIYRATWSDERSCVTTLAELADSMARVGITKHALIVIGGCLAHGDARSLLYDPSFGHECRDAVSGVEE